MTLIEGIGDEVTHFFIIVFTIAIIILAWWTTNISEQRHVRTILLLERRRHRAHRRLTNHTETVTITEGTISVNPVVESPQSSEESSATSTSGMEKPPETADAHTATPSPTIVNESMEAQDIIETMDSDNCVLRHRRLKFYNWNSENQGDSLSQTTSTQPEELPHTSVENTVEDVETLESEMLMEHNYAEHPSSTTEHKKTLESRDCITVKLKYINDDLKSVDGKLDEMLGDFKKRHFHSEISANKLVRLIFNGQLLQPDTQTLATCGLFDNCVVHCLIHQRRMPSGDAGPLQRSREEGYSFPNMNLHNFNNNNQNREWDLGNFLFAFISFILLGAWYFRYVYAHLYTITATVGLILITGIFTIVLVGMYFPDNEQLPNPTIRIARERVPSQQ